MNTLAPTSGAIGFIAPLLALVLTHDKTETRRGIRWPQAAANRPAGFNDCTIVCDDATTGKWRITWPGYSIEHVPQQGDVPALHQSWPDAALPCPYRIGEVLWLREPYYAYGYWREMHGQKTRTGKQKREFVASGRSQFPNRYSDNAPAVVEPAFSTSWGYHKRLARFMPKTASRYRVQITNVRAVRLGDLTEDEARAEGLMPDEGGLYRVPGQEPARFRWSLPTLAFRQLWTNINKTHDPKNWVWAITFRLVGHA